MFSSWPYFIFLKRQKKELQCEQHTSEVSDLLERLKGAEEKIQQLTGEKDALVEELKVGSRSLVTSEKGRKRTFDVFGMTEVNVSVNIAFL